MFEKHSCNMKPTESYIRMLIGTLLILYGVMESSYVMAFVGLFIYYTAIKKFCFIYYILRINERLSKQNYYLSFLPKHRSSPVFIFDEYGEVLFENSAAQKELSHIRNIKDLEIAEYASLLQTQQMQSALIQSDNAYYQVELKGVAKERFYLAYFTDISEIIKLNRAIEETQREVIYAMGEIGETRSKETGNHVKRVALYSKELALLYGLSNEEAELLQMASPMHDIGKVGIPDAILNAPRKLELDEWEVMQTHAKLGYDMLKSSNKPILKAAATIAYEHHEKWDGSGYPRSLRGEEIHIYGRITAVADVFDALGSERVYKKAWPLDEILALFDKESGKHFDPKLITLFKANLERFLEIRAHYND